MRLISLHIENFGGLSDIDMDFSNGINVIRRENGWGKSTLAEFIRVMFYGLEGGRKKEYSENDRIRFQPWNGQFFGGEITFEAGGKTYKIERNLAGKSAFRVRPVFSSALFTASSTSSFFIPIFFGPKAMSSRGVSPRICVSAS